MATTSTSPSQVRPRREREEELLVWPDLVFVEFICAVLFTISFTVISSVVDAPLINQANPNVTPNPSKAPWYFLNLQELLLHMNPALAGVVVPTVALILLAAVPYLDRSKEGQGVWFGTPNSVRISIFSGIFAGIGTLILILFDSSKQVQLYEMRWNVWGPLIVLLLVEATAVAAFGLMWLAQRPSNPKAAAQAAVGFASSFIVLLITSLATLAMSVAKPQWGNATVKPHLVWPFGIDRPHWLPHVGLIQAVWDLLFIRTVRSIQTEWTWKTDLGGLVPLLQGKGHDGTLDWPKDFTQIPIPFNGTSWPWHAGHHGTPPPAWYVHLPDWLTGLLPFDLNVNFPALLVEQIIPTMLMVGLPILLVYLLWRIGWVNTRRDVCISIFSGFIVVYWVMTIVGAAFRGPGQALVLPWDVPRIDG